MTTKGALAIIMAPELLLLVQLQLAPSRYEPLRIADPQAYNGSCMSAVLGAQCCCWVKKICLARTVAPATEEEVELTETSSVGN